MARLGMLVVVLGLLAWYVARNAEDFRAVRDIPWSTLAAALGLDVMIYVYSAAAIVLTVHLFGPGVGSLEALLLALLTRFGNLLLPLRGGAVVRAVYLNRKHGLTYAHFLAGLSAMLLATMAVSLVCAIGGLGYVGWATGKTFPGAIVLLAAALVAIALTVVLHPRIGSGEAGGLRGHIQRLLDGYHLVSRHRPSLLGLLAVSGLHVITMAGLYALLLAAMGKPAPWGLLIVIVALGNISTVLQVTPGNVGVYEGMLAILGSLMGLAPADILAASLAWRVLDTALILVAGPVSSLILTGKAMGPRR
ncbi:MAG: flippase-like domain-containing protein [Phycisphaerae bacterium]|nr:flippase-like domain-containing protein [Phycisphaerae bacterium]